MLFVLSAVPAGCTQERSSTGNAVKVFVTAPKEVNPPTLEYIIGPPDEISVHAPNIKEIDNSKQEVRSDGRISLNLLGEVRVAGLTPEKACDLLKQIAEKYYVNPDIKIEVVAKSKFYSITGRGVLNQGKRPFTGNDTVLKAIAEAGFNFETGWPEQVWLSRPPKNGNDKATVVVDFEHMAETGDLAQNYILEEGDIIMIPDTPLSSLNHKLELLLGPVTGVGAAAGSGSAIVKPGG